MKYDPQTLSHPVDASLILLQLNSLYPAFSYSPSPASLPSPLLSLSLSSAPSGDQEQGACSLSVDLLFVSLALLLPSDPGFL